MDHPGLPLEAFDLACVLDDSGRIRECARAPAQLRAALARGVPAESVILETDREALRAAISRARESDEPQRFSARLGDRDSVAFFALRLLRDARSGELVLAGIELPQVSGMPGADSLATLEVMERVNASLVAAAGLDQALAGALDVMLEAFDCDRAWLLFPCDPSAAEFQVPMERTRPGWQGAMERGASVPMNEFARSAFEAALRSGRAVRMDPECNPPPTDNPIISAYQVRSLLLVAVHPIGREPWCLGIHHCREARVYGAEVALLEAIGRRIGEALSRLLDVQALERSKQRFGVLLEHAPEAIVILDVERGRFVEFNGNAERLFGWSSAELLTKGPEELSPEFQPSGELSSVAARREIERAVAGEHPVFEWMHMDARGRHVPCEVRLVLLPDPERLVLRGSVTDISQRKASEQRQQVLESQLLQAQKMEALGQLTGGVAHDFNNILTVILGNSELALAQLGAQHSTAPLLAEALKATRKGATLTQRLLAFSRKQALVPRAVAVDALVRGMEEMLVRTLGESIRIETVMGAGLWDCEADPSQLENAILNLAINARDAMPDGGRLTIEASNTRLDTDYSDAHSDVPPGQYVLLAISDDGEGMSGEVMAQAFEPFFTTKDVGRGSGLGLSMVFGFAKQSRGHLKLYSEPGQGTTVKLYLPRSLDAAESSRATDEGRGEPRGSGQWILVVEDEPAVREYLTRALEELGYRTHQAGDAAAAVTLLESPLHVDLLLTDVVLPGGVNGAELARSAAGLRPDLRVLFISGYSENAIIHHGRLDPGVELLCKPFAKAKLARSVRDVLAR